MLKFLPLAVFALLAAFLYRGLSLNPSELPSPFIGKTAPAVVGATLGGSEQFDSNTMVGKVWVLNVWASWCRECVYEHPLFVQLADSHNVSLVGLNYKDQPNDATSWLQRYGNPYSDVVSDIEGSVGFDWGVYAVPETFVIDKQGVVRHKVIGPVSEKMMQETIKPLLDELMGQAS